ncbi:hypothetical protein FQA39_LY09342 [Lamprigera yunnana]|nr:hypothetical protein FQA39_LY09342 [Lamprigera yunnana]
MNRKLFYLLFWTVGINVVNPQSDSAISEGKDRFSFLPDLSSIFGSNKKQRTISSTLSTTEDESKSINGFEFYGMFSNRVSDQSAKNKTFQYNNFSTLNSWRPIGNDEVYRLQNDTQENGTLQVSYSEENGPNDDTLSKYVVSPNALIVTNTNSMGSATVTLLSDQEEKSTVLSERDLRSKNNSVIVLCTDSVTGDALAKFERIGILEEYKDVVNENEGPTEWSTLKDNYTSTLPAQLVVKNISMTIRDRLYYCQIVKLTASHTGVNIVSVLEALNPNRVDSNKTTSTEDRILFKNSQKPESPLISNNQQSQLVEIENETSTDENNITLIQKSSSDSNLSTTEIEQTSLAQQNFSSVMVQNRVPDTEESPTSQRISTSADKNVVLKETEGADGMYNASVLFESHVTILSESEEGDDSLSKPSLENLSSVDIEENHKKHGLYVSHQGLSVDTNFDHKKGSNKLPDREIYISTFVQNPDDYKKGSNKLPDSEMYISTFVKNLEQYNSKKIWYSKNPYLSSQVERPIYSTYGYHHSKEVGLDEDQKSSSKPIDFKNNEDDDDIGSDFDKIFQNNNYRLLRFS